MTKEAILAEARLLSEHERVMIAGALLGTQGEDIDAEEITDSEMAELDRRRQHLREHPEDSIPWEAAKKILWQSIRK